MARGALGVALRDGATDRAARLRTFTCVGSTRTPMPAVSRSATCGSVSPDAIESEYGWMPRSRRTTRRGPVTRTESGSKIDVAAASAGGDAVGVHDDASVVHARERVA